MLRFPATVGALGAGLQDFTARFHPLAFDVCTECAYTEIVGFEWDEERKAGLNFRKHGVRMPEAIPVFDDPYAITITDEESDPDEERFVTARHGGGWPLARGCVHLA